MGCGTSNLTQSLYNDKGLQIKYSNYNSNNNNIYIKTYIKNHENFDMLFLNRDFRNDFNKHINSTSKLNLTDNLEKLYFNWKKQLSDTYKLTKPDFIQIIYENMSEEIIKDCFNFKNHDINDYIKDYIEHFDYKSDYDRDFILSYLETSKVILSQMQKGMSISNESYPSINKVGINHIGNTLKYNNSYEIKALRLGISNKFIEAGVISEYAGILNSIGCNNSKELYTLSLVFEDGYSESKQYNNNNSDSVDMSKDSIGGNYYNKSQWKSICEILDKIPITTKALNISNTSNSYLLLNDLIIDNLSNSTLLRLNSLILLNISTKLYFFCSNTYSKLFEAINKSATLKYIGVELNIEITNNNQQNKQNNSDVSSSNNTGRNRNTNNNKVSKSGCTNASLVLDLVKYLKLNTSIIICVIYTNNVSNKIEEEAKKSLFKENKNMKVLHFENVDNNEYD